MNRSVSLVEQMTQQNAALVEQSAAASESLKDQAARLNDLVRAFQLVEQKDESLEPTLVAT